MKRSLLKAARLDTESKKRLDGLGVSYAVKGLPELWIHGETHQSGHKGHRRTVRSYRAIFEKRQIASASSLNTLLVRIERCGMQGFFRMFG